MMKRGHTIIELMVTCVIVIFVAFGIGVAIVNILVDDNTYTLRSKMLHDITMVAGVAAEKLSLATNIANVAGGWIAYYPPGGVCFDTNADNRVTTYSILTNAGSLRQVVNGSSPSEGGILIGAIHDSDRINNVTMSFLTNFPGRVRIYMAMEDVRSKSGVSVTTTVSITRWIYLPNQK